LAIHSLWLACILACWTSIQELRVHRRTSEFSLLACRGSYPFLIGFISSFVSLRLVSALATVLASNSWLVLI
jgi:hypothetical protein